MASIEFKMVDLLRVFCSVF